MKNKTWKAYLFWIVFTEGVGVLSALLTREGSKIYAASVVKSPLSPPPVVFPVAWTLLYALMGVGAAKVYLSPASADRAKSLRLFLAQLTVNFAWSFVFFNAQAFGAAFVLLTTLLALVLWMTLTFRRVDRLAAGLQIPYLLWLAFAGYLSLNVWLLNA